MSNKKQPTNNEQVQERIPTYDSVRENNRSSDYSESGNRGSFEIVNTLPPPPPLPKGNQNDSGNT